MIFKKGGTEVIMVEANEKSETGLQAEVARLREQVAELSRVKDYIDICQLQSTYAHLYFIYKRSEIVSLFAQNTPGVSVEIEDGGVFEGIEGVKRIFGPDGKLSQKAHMVPGWMAVMMTVNPVIEINKDGTKARGVWFSHGSGGNRRDGQMSMTWRLGKYDMEYVKEDGKWKFLKVAYRMVYNAPFDKGWAEQPTMSFFANPNFMPDKPTTWHLPYSPYRINIIPPAPPEPYED